jgi:plastocyanin
VNNHRFYILATGLVVSMLLAACGGGGPSPLSVTLKGEDIKFDQTSLTAQVGQSVTVNFENVGALDHSFLIDELGVSVQNVKPGETRTVTFTPQAAGTYTYYCDVAGHREAGMVGTLTVNP